MSRWLRLPRPDRTCGQWLSLVLMLSIAGAHAAEWDIANTGQPDKSVEFTLSEGTWMSVDVSPDGQTLLFDLLGDIYRLSASGADATLVHGGPRCSAHRVSVPTGAAFCT